MKELFQNRSYLKKLVREFFEQRDFVETPTPVLVETPGIDHYIDYFSSQWIDWRDKERTLFLRSSPEIQMKRLLGSGLDKIFQIGPCFRNNGEYSQQHLPEFEMLEWYAKGLSFEGLIAQTVELLRVCSQLCQTDELKKVLESDPVQYTVCEAFERFANLELVDLDEQFAQRAVAAGVESVRGEDDFQTTFSKVLLEKIEPQLKAERYVILRDFPSSQCALAKEKNGVAQRFEIYLEGWELCNGYEEELTPEVNLKRFAATERSRRIANKSHPPLEDGFLEALRQYREVEVSGNALGFDRLLAILLTKEDLSSLDPFSARFVFAHNK